MKTRSLAVDVPTPLAMTPPGRPDGENGWPLRCEIDLAMVRWREAVAGLNLDVGKPVLARFYDCVETSVRSGDWSGFLIRTVDGTDFGLVGLMKVEAAEGAIACGSCSSRR